LTSGEYNVFTYFSQFKIASFHSSLARNEIASKQRVQTHCL